MCAVFAERADRQVEAARKNAGGYLGVNALGRTIPGNKAIQQILCLVAFCDLHRGAKRLKRAIFQFAGNQRDRLRMLAGGREHTR
jgi:hypothetical protein